jgi:hypothetical protein
MGYQELVVRLRALATKTKDEQARSELFALAARYERLASRSAELADKYPHEPDSGHRRLT